MLLLTIITPIVWFVATWYAFFRLSKQTKSKPAKATLCLFALIISLLPLHGFIAIPLAKIECKNTKKEHIITTFDDNVPVHIEINNAPPELSTLKSISELLNSGKIKSIRYTGNKNDFVSSLASESIHSSNGPHELTIQNKRTVNDPIVLSLSNSNDIACGPFYNRLRFAYYANPTNPENSIESLTIPTTKCIAISREELAEPKLMITKVTQPTSSWRTLFYETPWERTLFEVHNQGQKILLAETKSFQHKSNEFIFFPKHIQRRLQREYGYFKCTPEKSLLVMLDTIYKTNNHAQHSNKLTRELADDLFKKIDRSRYLTPPDKNRHFHEINIYPGKLNTTEEKPANFSLNIGHHDKPVFIYIENRTYTEIEISTEDDDQELHVYIVNTIGTTKLTGRKPNSTQIWQRGDNVFEKSTAPNFYDKYHPQTWANVNNNSYWNYHAKPEKQFIKITQKQIKK